MVTTAHDHPAAPRTRALRLAVAGGLAVALPVLVLAVVVGALTGAFVVALVVGVGVGVGIGAAVAVPAWRHAEARVLDQLDVSPADPIAHARLFNLVEGLCTGAGLPRPQLFTLPARSPNGLALGRDPRHGAVVVTEGLLADMSRMELEGLLAHLLCRLREGDTAAATIAASLALGPLGPLAARWVPGTAARLRLADVDRAAASLTRYPPGLLAALQHLQEAGPDLTGGAGPVVAPLWISPPAPRQGPGSLEERIEALAEL